MKRKYYETLSRKKEQLDHELNDIKTSDQNLDLKSKIREIQQRSDDVKHELDRAKRIREDLFGEIS